MDARVRLEVLGAFALRSASQVLVDDRWPRSKAKALLKLLAITPGHRLHREQVAELVWPDLGPAGAADQLYKNLHFLRSRIAEPGFASAVRTSEERLELEPGVEVDVDRFRTLAARARAGGGRAAYIDALQVYRGELLPDDLLEEWAAAPRDELAAMARDLRLELLRIEEERGDLRAAIAQAQSVLLTEPTCEPAHRALMRLLADSGDRAGAIRQYHRCREALRRELEVDPSEETEALHRRLLEEGVARPVSTGAENLPLLEELGDVTRRTGEVDRSVALSEASLARALEAGDDAATLRLRGKAAQFDNRGRRQRKVCALAIVLLLALSVSGCGGRDAGRTYLEDQPEYNLTYPGAVLTSTTSGGVDAFVNAGAYVKWEFTSSSSLADIADWYAAQLGPRKWVGGLDSNGTGPGGGPIYFWQRPCLILTIDGYPAIAGQAHYKVSLGVEGEWQWASQLQSLRDRPEASIAPGGAAQLGTEMFSATLQPGGTLLFVQRSYRWSEGRLAALQFYDNSLVALGWTRVKPPGSEPLDNATAGTWQKGSVLARLTFKETTSLTFTLNESVDAQGSPVPPPSAS